MISHFLLIVATTYRPTLHKRHNDEVHEVNIDRDFNSKHLVGRRQSSRDSNLPPLPYHGNNLKPYSAVSPLNGQAVDVLLRKIDELTALVKVILIRSFVRDEKFERKNRQIFLYEVDVPKTDESESAIWLLPQIRNLVTKEGNVQDSSVSQIIRSAIPYEMDDVSLLRKKSQAGE